MFYPGARVVAHGLKSRSDLNDSCGIVVSRRQRGRWAVQFGCNDQALSVAGKNLALSTATKLTSCQVYTCAELAARPMTTCAAGTAHSNASRVATESTGCQRHSCAVKLVEQSYRSTDVAGPRP